MGLVLAAGGVYAPMVRPWMLRWGARPCEAERELVGDGVVDRPRWSSTRAVTIDAAMADVWPWLAQLGADRAGFYSYDWLETRFGVPMHNADQIVEAWQDRVAGDQVRLGPQVAMVVEVADPPFALVLRTPGDRASNFSHHLPFASWAFVLVPLTPSTCRLLVRWRSDYAPHLRDAILNQYLLEPVHFMMERRMLLGIKERAERAPRRAAPRTTRRHRRPTAATPPRSPAVRRTSKGRARSPARPATTS
jgi:hypothetical protein